MPLAVPPPNEQYRIVELLEDHLSRLDAADTGLHACRARLLALQERAITSALLGESVVGGRTPADLAPCGTDDGELPDLPVGWRWQRLAELTVVVGGVTKDAKRQANPDYVEIPYLRVANVQRGRLELENITTIRVSPAKADALRLLPGDVLLNEGGDRDKLARGWVWEGQLENCIHQNHVFRARVIDKSIEPRLLSWAANTLGARWAERNGKQSVNLASISLTRIRQMPIPTPPSHVQPELVARISTQLEASERLMASIDAARRRSALMRRALLGAAFSGRLTGRSRDKDVLEEIAGV